jgi:AAA+ ATPase superfamily predicted ATPase
MTFFDREAELDALETAWNEEGHDFVVLYGRRRVGKTALLKEFCRNRSHVYYLASQEAEDRQRTKFVQRIANHFEDRTPAIDTWPEAFEYLAECLQREDTIVAVDEFPYIADSNDSIPSYLQYFLDEQMAETESMLILCGSSIGVMESEVLGHESPLYGRRSVQIDLQPFSFGAARRAIQYDEIAEAIRSYSVTGGTPMYLTLFDYDQPLGNNVRSEILSPRSVLYTEPEFLLRTELRNPARYMSILEAVATGHTTPNEVSGATGIDQGPLSNYLQTLRRLRLIDREIPVTASQQKSKRSQYKVADPFLRFWFRYVEPNRSSIEEAPDIVYEDTIEPDLPHHVGTIFEDVCREALWAAIRQNVFARYSEIGRWWYGGKELDVIGLDPANDRILFGECKWTNSPIGRDVVERLEATAPEVQWGPDSRSEQFVLFSKSGFESGLVESLGAAWHCFDLADLEHLFVGD